VKTVALRSLFADRVRSIDPAQFASEHFELWSIPSYDVGKPDELVGAAIGSSKKLVQPNDVLLSRIIPHIRRAWVVGVSNGARQLASSEWIVFRSPHFVPKYLRHFFLSDLFHAQFMQTVAGVGGSLLRARPEGVGAIEIPLPPLDEQRRIAAILDQTDDLRRKREEAYRKATELSHALYRDKFGDPVTNFLGHPATTLGALGVEMEYGPRFYNEAYSEDGTKIVRITDLSENGDLNFDAMPKLSVSRDDLERHKSRPGDLLFARTGATVGKLALISPRDPICIPGAYFIRLRFPPEVDPTFAWYTLRAKSIQTIILERSRQSAQQNFSGPGLRRLPFIVPPMALQQSFAASVSEIDKLRAHGRAHLAKLDALFVSLQHRAFRGEL
jgi:type I restriction enzyme S subunit